jgi:hypothetical protein
VSACNFSAVGYVGLADKESSVGAGWHAGANSLRETAKFVGKRVHPS